MLFSIIYRSWCHAPVSVFALCLLAQAYEHASNLLQLLYVPLRFTFSSTCAYPWSCLSRPTVPTSISPSSSSFRSTSSYS
jgi:hypothetical protein